jgi:uncharacterized ferredoxin-like protein
MPTLYGEEQEKDAIMQAAKLMLVSARTAPKSGGVDDILTALVYGEEKGLIATKMSKMADERSANFSFLERDAKNVRDSEVLLLIGVRGTKSLLNIDCGGCGYASCAAFEKLAKRSGQDFEGPTCIFKSLDLGIALGSAVKTASILNVDNRIMYSIGTAAKQLNYLPEASIIMGIPLSAKGKSKYYDRE